MASAQSYRVLYGPANPSNPAIVPATGLTATPPNIVQNDGSSPRKGGHFVIDVTSGTAISIVVTIDAFDPASNKWYNILTSAALTAVGTTVLKVYPGYPPATNVVASDNLPPIWRLVMTHGNTNPATYTVSARLFD